MLYIKEGPEDRNISSQSKELEYMKGFISSDTVFSSLSHGWLVSFGVKSITPPFHISCNNN
jgi:hypothetical protein